LGSFLKTINPSLVIMPFWKSHNQRRKILANTSLIACRGIGSILMYEPGRNRGFQPTVHFEISADEIALKTSCLREYRSLINEPRLNRKVNCFNIDLLTMKKYQLALLPRTSTSVETSKSSSTSGVMLEDNFEQQLLVAGDGHAEIEKLSNAKNEPDNIKHIARQTRLSNTLFAKQSSMDTFVEVFESHRMLLVDHDDQW
jgi:hypothetical protein